MAQSASGDGFSCNSGGVSTMERLSPAEVNGLVSGGKALLVDIRESMEHARERIPGAVSAPLDKLEHVLAEAAAQAGGPALLIFHCRSGARTRGNTERLAAGAHPRRAAVLDGGMEAWKAEGFPTAVDRRQPIDLMRQVQIAAGLLILIGVGLGALVHPWFYGLAGFVGAGLTFAGISGFCGMARLLARMPWNRPRHTSAAASV
jgi:rhodanese-related sulfurtransferase